MSKDCEKKILRIYLRTIFRIQSMVTVRCFPVLVEFRAILDSDYLLIDDIRSFIVFSLFFSFIIGIIASTGNY